MKIVHTVNSYKITAKYTITLVAFGHDLTSGEPKRDID